MRFELMIPLHDAEEAQRMDGCSECHWYVASELTQRYRVRMGGWSGCGRVVQSFVFIYSGGRIQMRYPVDFVTNSLLRLEPIEHDRFNINQDQILLHFLQDPVLKLEAGLQRARRRERVFQR